MESVDEIIIEVQIDEGQVAQRLEAINRKLDENKKAQAELKKEIKAGGVANAEQAGRLKELQKEYQWLEKDQQGLQAQTRALISTDTEYEDTLNGMRQRLSDLQKSYDALTTAERENEQVGGVLLQAIQAQDEAVKGLEASTGRHQRNVGNYTEVVQGLSPEFQKANQMLGTFGTSIQTLATGGKAAFSSLGSSVKALGKAFLTPPVGLIVVALIAIMKVIEKLREAFKKNDEAATDLQRGFAAFTPIIEAVDKVFESFAKVIGKVVNALGNAFTGVARFVEKIGLMPKGFSKASDAAKKLVEDIDALEEAERQHTVKSAEREREISELRAQAADKETNTAEQRMTALRKAADLERLQAEDEKRLAAERYRLAVAQAKQKRKMDDETKNNLAQLRAAMINTETAYNNTMRKLNKEIASTQKEIDKEAEDQRKAEEQKRKEAAQKAKEAAQARAQAAKEAAELELQIRQQLQDAMIGLIEDETQRAVAQRQAQGQREVDALRKQLADRKKLTAEAAAALEMLILYKEQETQDAIDKIVSDAAEKRKAKQEADAKAAAEKRKADLQQQAAELQAQQELDDDRRRVEVAQNAAELAQLELDIKRREYEELQEMDAEHKAIMFENETAYLRAVFDAEQAVQAAKKESMKQTKAAATSQLQATDKIIGGIGDVIGEFAEESKAAAIAQKAIALAQIAVQTGVALATGIASAQEVGFPANIVAVATTVATIMANVASAIKTVKSAKFAEGGIVRGVSYYGDRVSARVNSGEMILNADQQARLFDIANGGVRYATADYELQADMMAAAVAALPAPVMDYQEFTTFQKRTATYNEFATS